MQKNCVDMCARDGRGDSNLFVRKGGASQKKIGKHWNRLFDVIISCAKTLKYLLMPETFSFVLCLLLCTVHIK